MISSQVRIRISKFITRTLPVGRVMEQRGEWKESFCPRCDKNDETPHHVLQCSHIHSRAVVKKALQDLEEKLRALDTGSRMQSELITCISKWITMGNVTYSGTTLPIVQQTRIGWDHFLEGRIHTSFQEYMDEHYKRIGSIKTGELWTAVVIQTMWIKCFEPMWKHRNEAVHCLATKEKTPREILNLNYTMRELLSKAKELTLLSQDKYLMEETIQQLLNMTTGLKRGWILSMQTALIESEKAIVAENISMRNSMRRFRESGTCRASTDHQVPSTTTAVSTFAYTPGKRRRVKRHPARKSLPPLLRGTPSIKGGKKRKRHPLRKKLPPLLSYQPNKWKITHELAPCPKPKKSAKYQDSECRPKISTKVTLRSCPLTTIQEEWEFHKKARKKTRTERVWNPQLKKKKKRNTVGDVPQCVNIHLFNR